MTRKFLHVGCGPKHKDQTTRGFNTDEWTEVRFDIDVSVNPDIVGTMLDMSAVETGSMDALFSSHNIEHLYPHEVPVALAEFKRVLKPDGFLVITCPDLQSICKLIAEDKLTEAAYTSPAGPITPLDVLYGYRQSMAQGNLYMEHRVGFTESVLGATLNEAGFITRGTMRREYPYFDLYAVALTVQADKPAVQQLAEAHFPLISKTA